jgi:hypothetical protein
MGWCKPRHALYCILRVLTIHSQRLLSTVMHKPLLVWMHRLIPLWTGPANLRPARYYRQVTPSLTECERNEIKESLCHHICVHPEDAVFHGESSRTSAGTLLSLAKTCCTTRDEIMPLFFSNVKVHVSDLSIACWFGTAQPFSAAHVLRLELTHPVPDNVDRSSRERWLTQLLARFPRLEYLGLAGIHAHKDKNRWGTAYKLDDLRMMKFILDNTTLEGVMTCYGTNRGCEDDRYEDSGCMPQIAFVTQRSYGQMFQGDFQEVDFIDVEDELQRGLAALPKEG